MRSLNCGTVCDKTPEQLQQIQTTMEKPVTASDFRSTYLRRVTKLRDKDAASRGIARLFIVSIGAVVGGAFLLVLRARIFQDTPLTQPLYIFHDFILLPFFAYTHTYFFPISLVWWGAALILFLVWLGSFLLNVPLLRRAYYKACDIALADKIWFIPIPVWHSLIANLLVTTAHAFRRVGLRPLLLEHVVQRAELSTLHQLIMTRRQDTARRLQRLSDLRIRLKLVPSSTLDEYLGAAVRWSETLLWVQFFGQGQFLNSYPTHRQEILNRLKEFSQDKLLATVANVETRFRVAALADDLEQVASLARAPGKTMTDATRLTAHAQLVNSVQTRQRVLEQTALRLQSLVPDMPGDSVATCFAHDLAGASPDYIRYLGRLTMNIAEFVALECDMPQLAFSTLETFETLAFVVPVWKSVNATPQARANQVLSYESFVERLLELRAAPVSAEQEQLTVHRDAVMSVPGEQDYRLAAELAQRWHEKMSRTTDEALVRDKDSFDLQVLRPRALGLLEWQGAALDLARGPSPDHNA